MTTLKIHTRFFPLAWLLFFYTPVIEIDGNPYRRKWGTHTFEVEPGQHTVKIYFPYIWNPECGANQTDIKGKEGEKIHIDYNMPPWMLAKGKITVS